MAYHQVCWEGIVSLATWAYLQCGTFLVLKEEEGKGKKGTEDLLNETNPVMADGVAPGQPWWARCDRRCVPGVRLTAKGAMSIMTPRFLLVHSIGWSWRNTYISPARITITHTHIHRLSIMTSLLSLEQFLSIVLYSRLIITRICNTHTPSLSLSPYHCVQPTQIFLPHLVILCCVASYFRYRSVCTSIKEVVFLIRRHVRPMSTINAQWLHFINFCHTQQPKPNDSTVLQ